MKGLVVLSLSLASASAFSPSAVSNFRGLNGVQQRNSQLCNPDALSFGHSLGNTRLGNPLRAGAGYLDKLNKKNRRKAGWGGPKPKPYLERINKSSYNPLLVILTFPFTAVFNVAKFAVEKVGFVVASLVNIFVAALSFLWNQILMRVGSVVGGLGTGFAVGILSFFTSASAFISGAGKKSESSQGAEVVDPALDRVRVAEAIQAGSSNYLEILESESSQDYTAAPNYANPPNPNVAPAPAWQPAMQQQPAAAPPPDSGTYLERLGSNTRSTSNNNSGYLNSL